MERKHSDEKEIHQLRNRFRDLAEKSFRQGIYTLDRKSTRLNSSHTS